MKLIYVFYIIILMYIFSFAIYFYSLNWNNIESFKKYNHITYFDLGSNNGDSILWLFGYKNINISYHVPYPKFNHFPTSFVTVHSFEANPFMCRKINDNVEFLKTITKRCEFHINCPVAVSNASSLVKFKLTSGTLGSTLYFNKQDNRSNIITIKSINIIHYINNFIKYDDFNILKFDIEGEEYYLVPNLIKYNILRKFDIIFSEFHTYIANPIGVDKATNVFNNFKKYLKDYIIPYYEEYNISAELMKIYNHKIDILYTFRNFLFNYTVTTVDKKYIHL